MDTETFPQPFFDSLVDDPAAPAFEHGTRTVTRGEVAALIARCAGGLRAAGLGPGDGLAAATAVTPEGFAVQMAAHLLGCRVVGVRPGLAAAQLPHVLADTAALVADDTAEPALLAAAPRVLRLSEVDGDPLPLTALGRREDVATVTLTSGSTAAPKGAAITYGALTDGWGWDPAHWTPAVAELARGYRRFLLFGTLSSAVMREHLGLCLMSGGTAVIPVGPPEFPHVIAGLRATATLMTVPRLHHVLSVLDKEPVDLSSLRVLLVAGSPLSPDRLAEAFERIGPAVRQGYGQTELGMLTMLTAGDVAAHPDALASVGRACTTAELEIRDPEGRPVEPGRIGEVWVRYAGALSGSGRDETESADLIRDGWVRTRDLAHQDAEGYLYRTGRARDVLIVNAIVHYAGPIEHALAAHPDVAEAYVVGAPDERTGEAAHAFVVPAADREPDHAELRALVADALGEAAVPATITAVSGVPVAPSGKPDKRALLSHLRL